MSDNANRAPLLEASLNAIVNSPNFRDYEKEMAHELLSLRNSHDALVAALEQISQIAPGSAGAYRKFAHAKNIAERALRDYAAHKAAKGEA